MDAELQAFTQGGLNAAIAAWDHQVVVTTSAEGVVPAVTVTLHGVQSDVEVDPGELEQFGFKIKRVFSLVIKTGDYGALKFGMKAVESNTGENARFLYLKKDFLGTHLFFGSVNQ